LCIIVLNIEKSTLFPSSFIRLPFDRILFIVVLFNNNDLMIMFSLELKKINEESPSSPMRLISLKITFSKYPFLYAIGINVL